MTRCFSAISNSCFCRRRDVLDRRIARHLLDGRPGCAEDGPQRDVGNDRDRRRPHRGKHHHRAIDAYPVRARVGHGVADHRGMTPLQVRRKGLEKLQPARAAAKKTLLHEGKDAAEKPEISHHPGRRVKEEQRDERQNEAPRDQHEIARLRLGVEALRVEEGDAHANERLDRNAEQQCRPPKRVLLMLVEVGKGVIAEDQHGGGCHAKNTDPCPEMGEFQPGLVVRGIMDPPDEMRMTRLAQAKVGDRGHRRDGKDGVPFRRHVRLPCAQLNWQQHDLVQQHHALRRQRERGKLEEPFPLTRHGSPFCGR
jgi:hypothetical protein